MGKRFIEILRFVFDCVMEVIYPSKNECLTCKKLLQSDRILCESCVSKIMPCKEPYIISKDGIKILCYSAAYYTNIITEIIIRLKYKSDFKCGEAMAELMTEVIKKEGLEFDLITFVPMRRREIRKRGYNQSEYLAKMIGKNINKPVINSLKKMSSSEDQIGLNGLLRWGNLMGCFNAKNISKVKNKKILLVDDVVTTGATGFYCTSELLKNGAKEVAILTGAKSSI